MIRQAVAAFLCFATPALATEIQDSYQATWDEVSKKPDCTKTVRPDMVVFICEKEVTDWYFTIPGTPAHPGVMKRALVNESDGAYFKEDARSYGSDEAQPAFKAWMAPILDLDRQAKEYVKKHSN